MQGKPYKLIELFVIFIVIPISFAINYLPLIKLSIGIVGFLYIGFVLFRIEKVKFKVNKGLPWSRFLKQTMLKLCIIVFITTCYVWIFDQANLFQVLLNNPLLWIFILFIYSFFSVYPQELIYRTFFFHRYQNLFKSERLFIFINAIVFSLAHLFFRNALVVVLTFLGGILFALTFQKTKSTLLVSIEHAIYGCWLFTVGMGNMLGFPS